MKPNPYEYRYMGEAEKSDPLDDVYMTVLKATNNYDHKTTPEDKVHLLKKLQAEKEIIIAAFGQRLNESRVVSILWHLQEARDYDSKEPARNGFAILGNELFEELRPRVEEALKNGFLKPDDVLRAYCNLARYPDSDWGTLGVEGLSGHLDLIENGLKSKDKFLVYVEYLTQVCYCDKPEVQTRALDILNKSADLLIDEPQFPTLISKLCSVPGYKQAAAIAIQKFLEKHNLPFAQIYDAWEQSTKKHSDADEEISMASSDFVAYGNLESIRKLEIASPGICRFLYDEFNIADFGRYPTELLLKQREEFLSLDNPYGVVILPRADWNGAFSHLPFEDLAEQLQGEFSLRFAECEGKVDIARMLKKCDQLYNPNPAINGVGHKISLLILGGHGDENSIRFGGSGKKHILRIQDLARKVSEKTGGYLDQNPTIILASCSTGADKGIGQELSKKFNAKVVAPKTPTAITKFYGSKNRAGKFKFNAKYDADGSKNIFKQGEPVLK